MFENHFASVKASIFGKLVSEIVKKAKEKKYTNQKGSPNQNDVKEEVEILSLTLSTLIDKAIVVWLRRLKETAYDAENVLREWSRFHYNEEIVTVFRSSQQRIFLQEIAEKIKKLQSDFDFITGEILKYDLKTSVVISLEQSLNVLSRLMVVLKHTKGLVAIRGKWEMVTWLKNVRVRELQVDKMIEEFNKKTEELSPNNLDAKGELNRKLIESFTAMMVLIEEGKAGSKSITKNYQLELFSSKGLKKFTDFNKKLGSGGYSDVFEGEFLGKQVAVKVLKENGMVYETFLAERSTMGMIFHTNLVKLYGFCFCDDIKALVYEYMEKGSFDNILYKNPYSVEWSQLYGIALEIARGLAYLHGKGLIHHDVKAANVLLDKNLCPKITDFGVSNLMRSDATHITNTRTRGTDCYSAPEVYQPLSPINFKCDVYSFGIMMFEILGRRCSIPKDGERDIWFPKEVVKMWNEKPESVMEYCGIREKDREKGKIVLMVAMWCAQYTSTIRPSMNDVVEVLEKEISVTTPPYPFQYHKLFGHSMLPSLQEIPVNDKSLLELKEYSGMDLEEFTSGFSDANIIGSSSYGNVYKGIDDNGYIYDDDDYKKREDSESLLKLYEEKCPPGGENSVIIYTTTIEKMKKRYKESNDVRALLRSHQIKMIERDVWGDDVDYEDKLVDLMVRIPILVLFVKGRLIGGADEVKRLEAEDNLKVLLYGIPTEE